MTEPTAMQRTAARPWYREPWPWVIMSGPALVVLAGCYTLWLAVTSSDGLVADDYYKQGLAINQTLTRERAAVDARYEARVMFAPGAQRVRITLTGRALPGAVTLRLMHPTRAGLDQTVELAAAAGGLYEGPLAPPAAGRWRVSLEDAQKTWRLLGEFHAPADAPVVLGGGEPPAR